MAHISRSGIHYGWFIIFAGIVNLFACLGLGRFALGMLLPSMSSSLALDYSQMGMISTANLIGYLSGVLVCGRLVQRFRARLVIILGLLLVGGSMMLLSVQSNFYLLSVCYAATGIGSALANVSMMGLLAPWFTPNIRGRIAGLIIAGNGLGIMLSGRLIPALNATGSESAWRTGWLILGALVLFAAVICAGLLRNGPDEKSLPPMGRALPLETAETATSYSRPDPTWRLVAHLGSIYFMFGFTYVIFATFIVTTLVKELGFSEASAGQMWIWVGVLSLFSGTAFGWLSDRLGRRLGLMIVFSMQTCAYLLIGFHLTGVWIYLSITLFGLALWSVPSIMAATTSDLFPPGKVTTAFGHITFLFGIGQICGPTLAGSIAEIQGGFSMAYLLSALLTALAIVLTQRLKTSRSA